MIRRQFLEFQDLLPTWINRLPQVDDSWSAELQVLEGHSETVTSVVFSPNGQLLASGSDDGTVRLWETMTGTLLYILRGHLTKVTSTAFSPNSQLLVSGSIDRQVQLWETTTGALQQTIKAHSSGVESVAISSNGLLLATGSQGGIVKVWDIATGTLLRILEREHDSAVGSVIFSPDSRLLAAGFTDGNIWLWDVKTNCLQQVLEHEYQMGWQVTFSPDGHLLRSGSIRHSGIWNAPNDGPWRDITGSLSFSPLFVFSTDCRLLASCSGGTVVFIWDTKTGALRQTIECHSGNITSIAFSPDGSLLASGSVDRTIRLWDTRNSSLKQTPKSPGGSGPVCSVKFSLDGRFLASINSSLGLWNVQTGTLLRTISPRDGVRSMAFSPVDGVLASASFSALDLWDIMTGRLKQSLENRKFSSLTGTKPLAFSPDGRLLASCHDYTIRLWDTVTGEIQQSLEGHSSPIDSATFSSDGRLLASSSYDRTIRLWNTKTGQLCQTAPVTGGATSLEFSKDDSFLYSNKGTLHIGSKHFDQISRLPDPKISITPEQWIALNDQEVMWLPPEYRATCSAVKDNLLAIGHKSGHVSFIGFKIQRPSEH